MSRKLVTSLALATSFVVAGAAGAREYRFFEGSDRVYYETHHRRFEPISEPHIHLTRAARSFANGNRSYAAENLEKAAAGFSYFEDRAAGEDRRQLDRAGRALSKLARQVRRGDVDGVEIVERAVRDAERVLAGERVMETRTPASS
jgi:hypothetical protein